MPCEMRGHIVAEVRDVDNESLIRLVGGTDVDPVVSHDILGRLMLASVKQPGLALVYNTTLGFGKFWRPRRVASPAAPWPAPPRK